MGLFAFLTRRNAGNHLADTLRKLEARVGELESLQVSREIEWRETRDKLLRYLKRVSEVERRTGTDDSPARRRLLALKFPNSTGGD